MRSVTTSHASFKGNLVPVVEYHTNLSAIDKLQDFNCFEDDDDGADPGDAARRELRLYKQEIEFLVSQFRKFGQTRVGGGTKCICQKDELTRIFGVLQISVHAVWWVGSECITRFGQVLALLHTPASACVNCVLSTISPFFLVWTASRTDQEYETVDLPRFRR